MINKKYYQYTLKFLDFLIENNKKSPQIITNKSYFQCSIKYILCVWIFIKKAIVLKQVLWTIIFN